MDAAERLIVALDVPGAERAVALAEAVGPHAGVFKVGLELFSAAGPAVVDAIMACGKDVFLDLKLHDIPNTVAGAAAAAARLGASMITVHSLAGTEAVSAAREGAERGAGQGRPLVLAVTLLTSHREEDLKGIFPGDWRLEDKVAELAAAAVRAGADGVVCSPMEVGRVKEACPEALAVTPGVRPGRVAGDDQKRTASPAGAIASGADYLVVGRPVCAAPDPAAAAARIVAEMQTAFERR